MLNDLIAQRPDVVEGWLEAELDAQEFVANPANADAVAAMAEAQTEQIDQATLKSSLYDSPISGSTKLQLDFVISDDAKSLLRDATAFLVVCAPNAPSLEVAGFFLDELRKRRMPNPGVIVNQRHLTEGVAPDAQAVLGDLSRRLGEDLPSHTASTLLARLGAADRRLRELSVVEGKLVDGIRAHMHPQQVLWSIPRLEDEVNDLDGLASVGGHLIVE